MNGLFATRKNLTKKQTRLILSALLVLPWLLLLIGRSILSPLFSCLLGFVAIICTCIALTFLFLPPMQRKPAASQSLPSHAPESSLPPQQSALPPETHPQNLLPIPRTLADVHKMSPTEFEIFSAAVIVALGQGHRFLSHSGRTGDQGVDVRLQNAYGLLVVVQCKLYAPRHRVGSREMREFRGTIVMHDAAYGYFITSSTFTPAAYQVKDTRIRLIDGPYLETLLQHRQHESAEAFTDIRRRIKAM